MLTALVTFGMAAFMAILLSLTLLPPRFDDLEVVGSRVVSVAESIDHSGRSSSFYLDISLEGTPIHLRYYDGQYKRRRRILASMKQGDNVELWVLKSSSKTKTLNKIWQIRDGESLLVSYEELVTDSRGGTVFFYIILVINPSLVGVWSLWQAWRCATGKDPDLRQHIPS